VELFTRGGRPLVPSPSLTFHIRSAQTPDLEPKNTRVYLFFFFRFPPFSLLKFPY
jgi:hypothetical protein